MAQDTAVDDTSHSAKTQLLDAAGATTVIAEVSTADNSSTSRQQKAFTIAIPPEEAAGDDELVQYLTGLVNNVYSGSEDSFWTPGFKRTNAAEVREYLRTQALALAWRGGSSFSQRGDLSHDLLGCANIKMFPHEQTGEFGMLACDPVSRGVGVGRELLRFAEDEARRRGATHMRLELLQGDGWRHDFKDRIEAWYTRNGYQLVRVDDVQKNWAVLVPLLAKPTVMKVFIKQL